MSGFHLFPFRTEKLSPSAPMVLHTRGRVGSRRFFKKRSPLENVPKDSFVVYYWCPVNIMLKLSATLMNRPLRPSGNILASHWGVLPSLEHRSAFSASSSVQFALTLGRKVINALLCRVWEKYFPFLPKVRGGVAKRQRGLYFTPCPNRGMA